MNYINRAVVAGRVVSDIEIYTHAGSEFCNFMLEIRKDNGTINRIPVNTPLDIVRGLKKGNLVELIGQIRTYRQNDAQFNGFTPRFYALSVGNYSRDRNEVKLVGKFAMRACSRTTQGGRELYEFIIGVRRHRGSDDYVPCCAWDTLALITRGWEIGDTVAVEGTFCSKDNVVKDSYGHFVHRIDYNLMIYSIGGADEE